MKSEYVCSFAAFVIVAIAPISVDCMSSLCIDDVRDCSCCCDCLIFLLLAWLSCLGLRFVWVLFGSCLLGSLLCLFVSLASVPQQSWMPYFCGQVDLL